MTETPSLCVCPCACGYRPKANIPPHMTYDALWHNAWWLGRILTTFQHRGMDDALAALLREAQETRR